MRLAMCFSASAACLWALVTASSLQAQTNKTPKKPAKSVPSYRTTVPEVTSARWTGPLPALPRRADHKRDDYLAFIQRIHGRVGPSFRDRAGDESLKNQQIYARWEAFFLRVTEDPEYARWALKFITGDCDYFTTGAGAERKVSFSTLIGVTRACSWLLDGEALTTRDRELCRRWMRLMEERLAHWEYGAMNRSFGSALEQAAFAKWWPDDPGNGKRKAYADEVWNDWWPYRDTFENSMSYNGLSIYTLMVWLEITGQESLYQDPGFKAFLDRQADLATPLGVMPFQGDNPGWQSHPTYWIAIMEKMADVYRDGRRKWIAQRMFEYVLAHEAEIRQWNRKDEVVMARLMEAYLWADDSVKPEPPTTGCVTTHRKMARFATLEELADPDTRRHSLLLDKTIPDKIIFRTGWDAGAAFAMIEAAPILSHGHCDVGAVSCYMAEGSLLLTSTSYMVRGHDFHNAFVVRTGKESWYGWNKRRITLNEKMTVAVEDFQHAGPFGCARLRVQNYILYPLTVQREYMFLGKAGLWVRDTVEATKPFEADYGPAWQTTAVYGAQGPNWANTALVTIPVAANGELEYMLQYQNRPHDLLVYFVPADGAELSIDDVAVDRTTWTYDRPVQNNMTRRVWYKRHLTLQPGKPLRFNSMLIPHEPTPDAGRLAKGIESLLDHGKQAAMKVATGKEDFLIAGINPDGTLLEAGAIVTDAKWFVVTFAATGPSAFWLVDATTLTIAGRSMHTSAERSTVGGPGKGNGG